MILGSGNAAWHGDLTSHSEKEMIIGKVILEISWKNDVHNNYETDYSIISSLQYKHKICIWFMFPGWG